ncbi:D-alanyl-D-alanine carboxypeptidase family protein [Prosthecobacter sp.]|uniref:D-alanyl-D-alanine carboxypeptidase family protein n=1 Tax=Prosthecobacter sp. TaxID=1965333 RepID=UPI003784C405
MMRLIQLLMTGVAAGLLASCAEPGVTRAIPVAPNSQHMYAEQGDSAQIIPVMLPERPMLVASSGPAIRAASYLLLDARTGQHLAGRSFETARGVASTQKLVTALVVLDAGNLDKMVRVQASDVAVEPTRLGVRPGEVYSRRELLYAFLVKSANDVANVLARDNAGSIEAFAYKMNAKARSLGCVNSHFKNPHGLTVSGQYSTARDMARVAMAAYRSDTIRDIVRRKYFTFHRADGRTVTLTNTNELLGKMPECNGMKTGYTVASQRCLISSAVSGGREVILVQLGTKTKYIWDDARLMMSWGLQRLRSSGGVAMSGWLGN